MKNHFTRIFLITMGICLTTTPAFAYIDPGTGSYLIQIIIAVACGIGYTLKIYWKNVKIFIANLFRKKEAGEQPPEAKNNGTK